MEIWKIGLSIYNFMFDFFLIMAIELFELED